MPNEQLKSVKERFSEMIKSEILNCGLTGMPDNHLFTNDELKCLVAEKKTLCYIDILIKL